MTARSLVGSTTLNPNGTDDTAQIMEALAVAGRVNLGPGTFITSTLTIGMNKSIVGAGVGLTTIKLKDGANSSLMSLLDASGTLVTDVTLDGNKANNTGTGTTAVLLLDTTPASYTFSYHLTVQRLVIKDGANNGITIMGIDGDGGWWNWVYQLSNIDVENCEGYGMLDQSTDNRYDNFYFTQNKKADVYLKDAASNLYCNFKIAEGGETHITAAPNKTDGACIILEHVSRCTFTNIDIQTGRKDGLYAHNCRYLMFNGVDSQNCQGWGFYLSQCRGVIGTVSASQTSLLYNRAGDFYIDSTCQDVALACNPVSITGGPALNVTNSGVRCSVSTSLDGHDRGTATTVPIAGTWTPGDIVWNSTPGSAGFVGWVCVAAGTPGTWKGFGLIDA